MMLALLLLAAVPQDGCAKIPDGWSMDDPKPLQATGEGLWIGGIGFGRDDFAEAVVNESFPGGDWAIQVQFSAAGNAKFIEAQRCGVGRIVEISLDRKIISRPVLNEPVTAGMAEISGGWSNRAEAEAIAVRLAKR
jgi:hypothetical protein